MFSHAPVNLVLGYLPIQLVSQLESGYEFKVFDFGIIYLDQVSIRYEAPPCFGVAPDELPLALKIIFLHGSALPGPYVGPVNN